MPKKPRKPRVDLSGDDTTLSSNPFAALGGLREQLPAGESRPEPSGAADDEAGDSATAGRVILRRQKKGHGGKTVTRIEGLANDDALVARIKTGLGTGARKDGDDLIVQGDQRERLSALLEGLGYSVVIGS